MYSNEQLQPKIHKQVEEIWYMAMIARQSSTSLTRITQATLLARLPEAIWPANHPGHHSGHPDHSQNPRQEHLEESSPPQTCNVLIPNTSCNLVHNEWSGNQIPKVCRPRKRYNFITGVDQEY